VRGTGEFRSELRAFKLELVFKSMAANNLCIGYGSVFPVISNISVTITVTINGRVFPLPF
jgi:hypothetical protein